MPTKLLPHRRECLLRERVVLARAETSIKRGGEHLGWGRRRYCGFDRPSTLAGILDETAVLRKLGIFDQRHCCEIEQPRCDYRPPSPDLGYLWQVQVVTLIFRNFFGPSVPEDVETFGIGLH